jgi:hypothetical protein
MPLSPRNLALLVLFLSAFGCAGGSPSRPSEEPQKPSPQGPAVPPRVPAGTSGEDLRKLPPAPPWKPGDPVRDVPDLRKQPLPDRSPAVTPTTVVLDLARLPAAGEAPASIATSPPPGSSSSLVSFGDTLAVYGGDDRGGRRVAGPFAGSSMWRGSTSPCAAASPVPRTVLFDPAANRWLVSHSVSNGDALHLCVAVAGGPDPVRSGWFLYDFALPVARAGALELAGDAYLLSIERGRDSERLAFDRQAMLGGAGATFSRAPAPGPPRR